MRTTARPKIGGERGKEPQSKVFLALFCLNCKSVWKNRKEPEGEKRKFTWKATKNKSPSVEGWLSKTTTEKLCSIDQATVINSCRSVFAELKKFYLYNKVKSIYRKKLSKTTSGISCSSDWATAIYSRSLVFAKIKKCYSWSCWTLAHNDSEKIFRVFCCLRSDYRKYCIRQQKNSVLIAGQQK